MNRPLFLSIIWLIVIIGIFIYGIMVPEKRIFALYGILLAGTISLRNFITYRRRK